MKPEQNTVKTNAEGGDKVSCLFGGWYANALYPERTVDGFRV